MSALETPVALCVQAPLTVPPLLSTMSVIRAVRVASVAAKVLGAAGNASLRRFWERSQDVLRAMRTRGCGQLLHLRLYSPEVHIPVPLCVVPVVLLSCTHGCRVGVHFVNVATGRRVPKSRTAAGRCGGAHRETGNEASL